MHGINESGWTAIGAFVLFACAIYYLIGYDQFELKVLKAVKELGREANYPRLCQKLGLIEHIFGGLLTQFVLPELIARGEVLTYEDEREATSEVFYALSGSGEQLLIEWQLALKEI